MDDIMVTGPLIVRPLSSLYDGADAQYPWRTFSGCTQTLRAAPWEIKAPWMAWFLPHSLEGWASAKLSNCNKSIPFLIQDFVDFKVSEGNHPLEMFLNKQSIIIVILSGMVFICRYDLSVVLECNPLFVSSISVKHSFVLDVESVCKILDMKKCCTSPRMKKHLNVFKPLFFTQLQ